MSRRSQAIDWIFRNRKTGKITIGQSPNLTQKMFQRATVVGVLLPRGGAREALGEVAIVSLAVWAVDEVARGVNPFRRFSGVVTLGAIAWLAFGRGSRAPRS